MAKHVRKAVWSLSGFSDRFTFPHLFSYCSLSSGGPEKNLGIICIWGLHSARYWSILTPTPTFTLPLGLWWSLEFGLDVGLQHLSSHSSVTAVWPSLRTCERGMLLSGHPEHGTVGLTAWLCTQANPELRPRKSDSEVTMEVL